MEVQSFQSFAEFIKAIRYHSNLSQRALAKILEVSPGYVGQWELGVNQPSVEVVVRLCQKFEIDDIEFIQRLAFAQRAPEWLRESIIQCGANTEYSRSLTASEKRVLQALRRLSTRDVSRLVERIEGWVEALSDKV